jgi:hypothetical protein
MRRLLLVLLIAALFAGLAAWLRPTAEHPEEPAAVDAKREEPETSFRRGRRTRNRKPIPFVNAVDLGHTWLTNAQAAGGEWTAGPRARTTPAVTGLVLLSFFGAGEAHNRGRFKETVKSGLRYLKRIQDRNGCFGESDAADLAANHAIATLAMCEARRRTGSPLFKASAQRALDFIARRPPPDSSVVFWELLALHSGGRAGLAVPEKVKLDAAGWLDRATDPRTGVASCASGGVMPESVPGPPAAAAFCRVLYGEDPRKSEPVRAAAKYLVERRPGTRAASDDPGLLYFGTLAMYHRGGDGWKRWNEAIKDHVIETQMRTEEHAGTWTPEGRSGDLLGRPGTTALHLMVVEVYYHGGRVFGTRR